MKKEKGKKRRKREKQERRRKKKEQKKKRKKKCFTDVCAVSVHNVFTTTNELKGKATQGSVGTVNYSVVTVYACRQCACSRQ